MSRIFHTADWHLGARLIDQDRLEEHRRFLDWLLHEIQVQQPHLLVIAGDVFDTAHPPQQALRLYYDFLAKLSQMSAAQVLILGGNHDSVLTLQAPRELLLALRIQVVGSAPEDPAQALLELEDAVLCAAPFLRERDVRRASLGETFDSVARQMKEGITRHYRRLQEIAAPRAAGRPVLATGHLTVLGGRASESERPIHVGNLAAMGPDCFAGFDYVALGHLHRPQAVGDAEHIQYAGSPIPLSFDEWDTAKQVVMVDIAPGSPPRVTALPIPTFRRLRQVTCSLDEMGETLQTLKAADGDELTPWIDLTVRHDKAVPDLDQKLRALTQHSRIAVLKWSVQRTGALPDEDADPFAGKSLDELQPQEVFAERLRREKIAPDSEELRALTGTFAELLTRMTDREVSGETSPAVAQRA